MCVCVLDTWSTQNQISSASSSDEIGGGIVLRWVALMEWSPEKCFVWKNLDFNGCSVSICRMNVEYVSAYLENGAANDKSVIFVS